MCKTILLSLLVVLAACTKTSGTADQRSATVHLADGSTITGTVTESSPKEVTLAQADQTSRVIPVNQVKSIEYADPPAPAASVAPASDAPAAASSPPPATAAPASEARVAASSPSPQPAALDEPHENHYHPRASAIRTKTYILPVGTELRVRSEETIDSSRAVQGQTFAAEISRDVVDESGAVVIPAGSNAKIMIKSASKGGHFHGASDLVLDLDSVSVDGQSYRLVTTDIEKKGRDGVGANKRTAEFSGGGAAIGAIIGAIAGGGKGAAIGAGSGAGAGAVTEIVTKGPAVKVPAETILTFRLDSALRVTKQK
jgi:hypothetical protein